MIQKSRPRFRVRLAEKATGQVISDHESSWPYAPIPQPKNIGDFAEYVVEVTYLGDHQFKKPYEKRLAAHKRQEEAAAAHAAEEAKKATIRRRARIMNQIELAFVKQGKDAVKFVTCDVCSDLATVLTLSHENPGSDVINPDQITGARCDNHKPWPNAKVPVVPCAILEFFYDGVKQIYINSPAVE
jgi:hypothetical protein